VADAARRSTGKTRRKQAVAKLRLCFAPGQQIEARTKAAEKEKLKQQKWIAGIL
jgi:hypothetical protein